MPSDYPDAFLDVYDQQHSPPPQVRARQPTGPRPLPPSIWAPQPQPSETTWPKALDSFSRVADRDQGELATQMQPALAAAVAQTATATTREDVFGPVDAINVGVGATRPPPAEVTAVGAIGDGRKKISPGFEDTVS